MEQRFNLSSQTLRQFFQGRTMKPLSLFLLCITLLISCTNTTKEEDKKGIAAPEKKKVVIKVIYDGATLNDDDPEPMAYYYGSIDELYNIETDVQTVEPNFKINKRKYKATDLLDSLPMGKGDTVYFLYTNKTIYMEKKGNPYYRILGIATIGRNRFVVSNARTGNGIRVVRTMVHEFGHAYMKYNHCKTPDCIMCDYDYADKSMTDYKLCDKH